VTAGAARADVPSWLRVHAASGDRVTASRDPLGFAVQMGAAPAVPEPLDIVPAEKSPRALYAAGPTSRAPEADEDGTSGESADYVDETGAGFRLRTFRRGPAFALVIVPLGPDGETEGDDLALRIGRSLRTVE